MLDKLLNNDTFLTAQGAMNGLSARHAALSDNIANVNTPGYKRQEVAFEDTLKRALDGSRSSTNGSAALMGFTPQAFRDNGKSGRADGNNVDIEREMVQLTDNELHYNTLAQIVGGFFSGLKTVINSR